MAMAVKAVSEYSANPANGTHRLPGLWCRVSNVKGDQYFQPSGHFAGHRREAFDPSHDSRLTAIRTAGEIALGPPEDAEADQ